MSEPIEPKKIIEPDKWERFLTSFSTRNRDRRARFNIFFASGETIEEAEEGHLESISLHKDGDKTQVIIKRADRSNGTDAEMMTDTIDGVRGIDVQFETDGSENALEITDSKNTLLSLRFESKLDGNS